METKPILQPQMTVEDVLQKWPGMYSVFMKKGMKCIGCFLQRFCTLQDVAETYRIPLQQLIGEMEKLYKGASHEKNIQTL